MLSRFDCVHVHILSQKEGLVLEVFFAFFSYLVAAFAVLLFCLAVVAAARTVVCFAVLAVACER